MREQEALQPSEAVREGGAVLSPLREAALPTPEMIAALAKTQEGLLAKAKEYISRDTADLLEAKIALEHRRLRDMIDREARAASEIKKSPHILHRSYFTLRRLDPHSFE